MNAVHQSSRKGNCFSDCEEISRLLWNPKVPCCVHRISVVVARIADDISKHVYSVYGDLEYNKV